MYLVELVAGVLTGSSRKLTQPFERIGDKSYELHALKYTGLDIIGNPAREVMFRMLDTGRAGQLGAAIAGSGSGDILLTVAFGQPLRGSNGGLPQGQAAVVAGNALVAEHLEPGRAQVTGNRFEQRPVLEHAP